MQELKLAKALIRIYLQLNITISSIFCIDLFYSQKKDHEFPRYDCYTKQPLELISYFLNQTYDSKNLMAQNHLPILAMIWPYSLPFLALRLQSGTCGHAGVRHWYQEMKAIHVAYGSTAEKCIKST